MWWFYPQKSRCGGGHPYGKDANQLENTFFYESKKSMWGGYLKKHQIVKIDITLVHSQKNVFFYHKNTKKTVVFSRFL